MNNTSINNVLDFSFLNTLHEFDSIYTYFRNLTPNANATPRLLSPSQESIINNTSQSNEISIFQNTLSNATERILLNAEHVVDDIHDSVLQTSFDTSSAMKNVLSEKGKKQLKIIKYNSSCKNATCPITQTKFKDNEEVTQLPCLHCFESSSINHWLTNEKAACPVCRYNLDSITISKATNEIVGDSTAYNNLHLDQYYNDYIQQILNRYPD